MENFQEQVIERSFEKPVLVDFWASWCGPCRVLGPVIEKIADEQQDKFELVKVSTEEHPDIAQEYRVMSIPNVKLFHNGQVVGEFAGALPRHQIERWLEEHLPDPSSQELHEILAGAGGRAKEQTEQMLRGFSQAHPENKEARLALAQFIVYDQPDAIPDLLLDIDESDPLFGSASDLLQLSRLMRVDSANGSAAGALLITAKNALKNGDAETGIQSLIEAVMKDKHYMDDLPRLASIALFHIWGNNHELTREYRRQFDMSLY